MVDLRDPWFKLVHQEQTQTRDYLDFSLGFQAVLDRSFEREFVSTMGSHKRNSLYLLWYTAVIL
jgi:hypothetical protein